MAKKTVLSRLHQPVHPVLAFGVVAFLLMLIAGSTGYLLAIKNISGSMNQQQQVVSKTNQPMKHTSASTCTKQGLQPKDDYLPTYIVKPGDSLLFIAKSQLQDSSRVNELIILNKDRYPQLSLNPSLLEQGWKLYLPPQNVGITNGHIYVISGNIELYPDDRKLWGVRWNSGGGGTFSIDDLNKHQGKNQFKKGGCVTVIYQVGYNDNDKALSIFPQ